MKEEPATPAKKTRTSNALKILMCQRKTHEHSGAWPTGRFWNTLDYPCSIEILLHLESHGMKKELQHQMSL